MNLAIKQWFYTHSLFSILLASFGLQLIFLTRLPIFNDEAIYLDWGWRETHVPGFLFYSLYDAKQPLMMWLFGIAESIFQDPLFGGRLVALLFSMLSALGLYKLSNFFVSHRYSLFTVILFTCTPLFFFYNRQALMESAMICSGIWIGYYTLRMISSQTYKEAVLLGLVFGFSYFIKSTVLIFFLASLLVMGREKFRQKRFKLYFKQEAICLAVALSVLILLLIQPTFWTTLDSNNRYVLTIPELFSRDVFFWLNKVKNATFILLYGITPLVILAGVYGFAVMFKQKNSVKSGIVLYFLFAFIIQFTIARSINSRYLVPFLGIGCLFAAYGYYHVSQKYSGKIVRVLGIMILVIPLGLSIIQWFSPHLYLESIPLSENETYLSGQTSGYGISETVDYLRKQINGKQATIGVGLQSGNPESSIIMYFQKNPLVHGSYFDAKQMVGIEGYDCMTANHPVYFVSREEQLVGLDRFLSKVKTIRQKDSSYTIGIYTLKIPCAGKTMHLTEVKT